MYEVGGYPEAIETLLQDIQNDRTTSIDFKHLILRTGGGNGQGYQFKLEVAFGPNQPILRDCSLIVGVERASKITGSMLPSSTGSLDSLGLVKMWLRQCLNGHAICKTTVGTAQSPSRLLELKGDGIRLRHMARSGLNPAYATLSHCWGTLQITKLERHNLDTFQRTVPLDDLCQTFQDAVILTRALGINYLWIDSLCIIQDDERDWQKESTTMAAVYGNGTINIAAAHAQDGSHGLFIERDSIRKSRKYVRTNTNVTYELPDSDVYNRCLAQTALSCRAWAFQERYLAKRTVHFTGEQIFFECRSNTVCETWPDAFAVPGTVPPFSRTWLTRTDGANEWIQIVEHYSHGKLTFAKDRFIALSGVARQLQARTKDSYMAGMWRWKLERQLCWRVDEMHTEDGPPRQGVSYQAPSWSWASVDKAVRWRFSNNNNIVVKNNDKRPFIKILHISITPLVKSDPFGQLQDGTLTIQTGPMINASLLDALMDDKNRAMRWRATSHHFTIGDTRVFHIKGHGEIVYDIDVPANLGAVYFLPLIDDTRKNESKSYRQQITIYGLMVTFAHDRGNGYFRRTGVGAITFSVGTYKELINMLSEPRQLMEEHLYRESLKQDSNGVGQYAIILV
ncbi:heterokaryon incompatibility protein-domain-containing protein [Bisporella sp. PMI_857]|nr:heterokaryon incompatibility protein-domain-containing protein [Bisporella sp. PMI_857]